MGDNELVTRHVCQKVGSDASRIMPGCELDHMTDVALAAVVEQVHVFLRAAPHEVSHGLFLFSL